MDMSLKRLVTWGALAALVVVGSGSGPASATISNSDLNTIRSVLEGDWLRLKLEVLGLRLSYPAYRIDLELDAKNRIVFTFWIGVPMGKHLEEVGQGEAERILSYHARGIARQVEELVRNQFPEMWPTYGPQEDLVGLIMAPGDQWDSPPVEIAKWNAERLFWAP
jgi:hypothetical protein